MKGTTILACLRGLKTSNEAAAVAYRLSQAVALLASFRMITLHFGVASYGIVGLALSWVVYLTFLDFGVVSLLRSEIPYGEQLRGRRFVHGIARAGLLRLARYSIPFYAIFTLLFLFSDWPTLPLISFMKLDDKISAGTFRIFIVLIACYAACILVTNFLQALTSAGRMQHRVYHRLIIGAAIQAGTVFLGIMAELPLAAVFGLLILSGFILLIPFAVHEVAAIFKDYDPEARLAPHAQQTSAAFFTVQVLGTIANNIDTVLVAHFFSFRSVAVYSTMKLIVQMIISLHGNYVSQAWPLYSAGRARGDWRSIMAILHDRLRKTALFGIACVIGLTALCPELFPLWSKGMLTIGPGMSFAFGLQAFVYTISACFAILLYSFNFVRALAFLAPLSLVIMYVITWRLSFLGPVAIVIANIVAQSCGLGAGLYFYFFVLGKLKLRKAAI